MVQSVYRYCRLSFAKQVKNMFAQSACLTCYFTIVAVLLNATTALAQGPVTPQAVQKSIDKAIQALLADQHDDDGGWPEVAGYNGGVSSLVTLALLNAGMTPQDARISRALTYLKRITPTQTYVVSLQTMAFCAADPNKFLAEIQRNTEWLAENQSENGGWSYGEGRRGGADPSNSQFALLALHEAQRAGAQLPLATWKKVFEKAAEYWLAIQNRNGGFPYSAQDNARASMTCAGIASLVIVGSQLASGEAKATEDIRCCGPNRSINAEIQQALEWLGTDFSVSTNRGVPSYHLYYLYGLERAGRMTGQRFIGGRDWYREGCRELLNLQSPTGEFGSDSGHGNRDSETAFGLLFLAKGKRQNVISRLKYGAGNDWNRHSLAMQHLTAHTEQAWKRDLSWQTIDLERAKLVDLLETPVLFISGANLPTFSNTQRAMLREYVKNGGFIFAEACDQDGCKGQNFDEYIRRFAVEVFGKQLEKLPPEHPIWHAERSVDIKAMPENFWLYGVQTCCRLGMVYSPISLSCRWQLHMPYGLMPDYNEKVKNQLDNTTLTGINVLSYVTGKELKQKLQSVLVLNEIKNTAPTDRGVMIVPQLQHNAGADDAPRAVSTLIEYLGRENPFRMSSEHRMISITEEELQKYPITFMHGRGELRFNEAQRSALRTYFNNGGFLFADAICSDEQFTSSFRREMEVILGANLKPMDANHEVLRGTSFKGFDIKQVSVIDPKRGAASATYRTAPKLEFASIEDHVAVVFSPLDLSCALESRHSLQCHGYVRDDAARIGINVLLFGLQQ
jgi:Domain of unknown function (DUF4159)/Prenyltransferase and squalene oxidase repeat